MVSVVGGKDPKVAFPATLLFRFKLQEPRIAVVSSTVAATHRQLIIFVITRLSIMTLILSTSYNRKFLLYFVLIYKDKPDSLLYRSFKSPLLFMLDSFPRLFFGSMVLESGQS